MALIRCRNCGRDVSHLAKTCPRCGVDDPGAAPSRTGDIALGTFLVCTALLAGWTWWWLRPEPVAGNETTLLSVSLVATASAVLSALILVGKTSSVERRGIAGATLVVCLLTLVGTTNFLNDEEPHEETTQVSQASRTALSQGELALSAGDYDTVRETMAAIPEHERHTLGQRYARIMEALAEYAARETLDQAASGQSLDLLQKLAMLQAAWASVTAGLPPPGDLREAFEHSVLGFLAQIPSADRQGLTMAYEMLSDIDPDNADYAAQFAEHSAALGGDAIAAIDAAMDTDLSLTLRGSVIDAPSTNEPASPGNTFTP